MLHADWFLKAVALVLMPAALAVKGLTPSHTVAYHIADVVLGVGAGLGIYSSTGRELKAP